MDKFLRPERFDTVPNSAGFDKAWIHWKRTFTAFLVLVTATAHEDVNKLDVFINYISPTVYELISDCTDFETALQTLENIYIVPKNEIFARHLLATRRQHAGESIDVSTLMN